MRRAERGVFIELEIENGELRIGAKGRLLKGVGGDPGVRNEGLIDQIKLFACILLIKLKFQAFLNV